MLSLKQFLLELLHHSLLNIFLDGQKNNFELESNLAFQIFLFKRVINQVFQDSIIDIKFTIIHNWQI